MNTKWCFLLPRWREDVAGKGGLEERVRRAGVCWSGKRKAQDRVDATQCLTGFGGGPPTIISRSPESLLFSTCTPGQWCRREWTLDVSWGRTAQSHWGGPESQENDKHMGTISCLLPSVFSYLTEITQTFVSKSKGSFKDVVYSLEEYQLIYILRVI